MKKVKFRLWDIVQERYIPENVYVLFANRADFGAIAVMITDWQTFKKGQYFYPTAFNLEMFINGKWEQVEIIY